MKYQHQDKGIVLLEDGTVFEGKAVGYKGTATGEICFNTGMTGYQEIFTDPSYYGQILVCTTPHIGNYGVVTEDQESDEMKISGLICKRFSNMYSRYRASEGVIEYFEKHKKVVVSDVDTRAIVEHIRDKGAMNVIISNETTDVEALKKMLKDVPSMDGLELASKVSTKEIFDVPAEKEDFKVALIDLGTKRNIIRCLNERNCSVRVFPMTTNYDEVMSWQPDGIMLSNGPGDPAPLTEVIELVKQFVEKQIPLFGICLGHQVLSLASGLPTTKMHNGHRGINHPVKNLVSGQSEVTSQNHGFVVDMEAAKNHPDIEVTHEHLNDGTLAGIQIKGAPAFSVQFHPEAAAGPLDTRYLFDQFVDIMQKSHKAVEV